jgi:hypothetical protein
MNSEAIPPGGTMGDKRFATAINCMDGRVQMPVFIYLTDTYGVDYVDMITEPGPIRILAQNEEKTIIESIKKRVEISMFKHSSKLIALVAHHDCAGNPVGKDTQIEQMSTAIELVRAWQTEAQVIGLWVDKDWEVIEVEFL